MPLERDVRRGDRRRRRSAEMLKAGKINCNASSDLVLKARKTLQNQVRLCMRHDLGNCAAAAKVDFQGPSCSNFRQMCHIFAGRVLKRTIHFGSSCNE